MSNIKNFPKNQQPRERLLKVGVKNLNTYELISILIGSGTKDKNVVSLSQEVCLFLENNNISNLTVEKLMEIKGIKLAKATTIIAALELRNRFDNISSIAKISYLDSYNVYQKYNNILKNETKENLYLLILNIKGHLIKEILLGIGTINSVLINQREIYEKVLQYHGVGYILIHNHPSGDCMPSNNDIENTNKLISSSNILDIKIVDHIIIGKNQYYSFKSKKSYIY